MKSKHIVLFCVLLMAVCSACTGNTYSKQRQKEKTLIDAYISRLGLITQTSMPSIPQGESWDKNLYVELPGYDQLYFHLSSPVDSTRLIAAGDKVNVRFRKYSLDIYADTISYWTTDDAGEPLTLTVGSTSGTFNCAGWQAAILSMGYEGECTIICPSVYGPTEDNATVTPYCYDLRVVRKR